MELNFSNLSAYAMRESLEKLDDFFKSQRAINLALRDVNEKTDVSALEFQTVITLMEHFGSELLQLYHELLCDVLKANNMDITDMSVIQRYYEEHHDASPQSPDASTPACE